MRLFIGILFAATVMAGPLTIQTQEAIWTNGLDTITLGATTVEGPGTVALAPYVISVADDPSSRSIVIGTQDALLGDLETPITIQYTGIFTVVGGTYHIILSVASQEFPNEVGDGSRVTISSAGALNASGSAPDVLEGTLNGRIGVAAPEPGTWALIGIGLATVGIRRAYIASR